MANAFGRARSWRGGTGSPPTSSDPSNAPPHQGKTDSAPTFTIHPVIQKKLNKNETSALRTKSLRKITTVFSQSPQTFVKSNLPSLKPTKIMSPPSIAQPVVTPNKPSPQVKLTNLGVTATSNRFFTSKRKKAEEEHLPWSKDKLIQEVQRLWITDATKKSQTCEHLTEQELRKELYEMMTSSKKQKNKDEATMDIGNLLLDSTMEYIPILDENSTDEDILRLEKHDAILELAHYIQKCGKRANMHQLHEKTLQELQVNLRIARDDHIKVTKVFPELQGENAKWFGPRSERRDQDYEPSVTSESDPKDWWDDCISDDELKELQQDHETPTNTQATTEKMQIQKPS